jgi:hypothetical protein
MRAHERLARPVIAGLTLASDALSGALKDEPDFVRRRAFMALAEAARWRTLR